MAARASTPREWGIALLAGLGLSALLVALWRGPDPEAVANAPVDPVAVAPLPPVVTAAPVPIIPPVPVTGYHLRGLIARHGTTATAIVEDGDGHQRLVRIGSQLGPGLVVNTINGSGLTLTSADGDKRLDPRRVAGITRGFTLVDASRLPLFRTAGLKTGDIIIMINGSAIDSEEKVMELPAEINGAKAVEILYERSGKRETAHIAIAR